MHKLGITGRAFRWIKSFLVGRSIQVQVGIALSGKVTVDNGTPQGSVISPLLFSIMVNDVFSGVELGVMQSLFADDGALWRKGKSLKLVQGKIQTAIRAVENWSFTWGFKFSVEKTKYVVFSRRKPEVIELKIYGQKIEQVNTFRFLGVIFDSKLLWSEHIKYVEDKCKKVVNIMRCLLGSEWGADRAALKNIYISLIRAVMDYGSLVYKEAAKTQIHRLEIIQNQALRLCCGALKTSPISAVQVEMGELPLDLRYRQVMMQYWATLQGYRAEHHPAVRTLQPCWESGKATRSCFAWTANKEAQKFRIQGKKYCAAVPWTVTPYWFFSRGGGRFVYS